MAENILIIEDEALIALSMEVVLAERGYRPTTVSSASEARRKLEGDDDFAGVILDFHLGGQSTIGLAEQLLERGIPFVLCSGTAPAELPEAFRSVPFVNKPFSEEVLLSALEAAVRKP